MSVKIRIAILVMLLLSVVGVTAVSASSTMSELNYGIENYQNCTGCVTPWYGWFCRTYDGNINYYASGCVWSHYAICNYNWCTCMPLGASDYCTYGFQ